MEYNARSRTLKLISQMADELPKAKRLPGSIAVVSADTADQMVSEECRVLSDYLGCYTYKITDVGANNLQRLLAQQDALRAADVLIVVCGTDCALPSLVAGMTIAPVVSVCSWPRGEAYMHACITTVTTTNACVILHAHAQIYLPYPYTHGGVPCIMRGPGVGAVFHGTCSPVCSRVVT